LRQFAGIPQTIEFPEEEIAFGFHFDPFRCFLGSPMNRVLTPSAWKCLQSR
jgi:hypothetical protein